jgi:hypothetical protein
MSIDYDRVLLRYAEYKASPYKNLRSLSQGTKNRLFDRVSQANTEGSQCALCDGDIVINYVENKVVGGLAQMLPVGATDREVLDEVYLGNVSLATLIHCASDAQWARVLDGRGNERARRIFRQLDEHAKNKIDCYHIRLVADGQLLQGFITKHKASPHIEAYLAQAQAPLTVYYGYQKAEVLNSCLAHLE